MKKVILATTLIFTLFTTTYAADTHVDYVRRDGSATRVTYTRNGSGNTTVTTTRVSREQRANEQQWEAVKALAALILKAIFSK